MEVKFATLLDRVLKPASGRALLGRLPLAFIVTFWSCKYGLSSWTKIECVAFYHVGFLPRDAKTECRDDDFGGSSVAPFSEKRKTHMSWEDWLVALHRGLYRCKVHTDCLQTQRLNATFIYQCLISYYLIYHFIDFFHYPATRISCRLQLHQKTSRLHWTCGDMACSLTVGSQLEIYGKTT